MPQSDNFEAPLDKSDNQIAEFDEFSYSILQRIQRFLHDNAAMVPVIILVMSIVAFGFFAGGRFFSLFNLSLIMQQVAIVGILASAQTLIILTAGIDLSVAAIMVLSYVVMGKLAVEYGVPAPLAIGAGMLVAIAAGAINGFFVTKVKMPPFIVTLGTWQIFLAVVYLYTGSQSIRSQDIDATAPLLKFFGERVNISGAVFTYGVVLMIVVFVVLWYMLNRTSWGRHVYAVGDDKEAADLSGIRSDRLLLSVYALAGLICGIAAWAAIGRVGSVSPNSFVDANLGSITAVVIGGTSLFGGRGAIFGSLFGALIVGVFSSGLKLAGADPQWELFAIGWLIIAAVALDQWIRRVSA
ncbi:Fructose ABC transporter, permease component FrcC [hydrothermal vent metagenome]|uniref:Fructose ABC transporter, permease component FrcC n=1 Tax=hydrothermal vent metagenome TaxID=652676 RepID=A0A3B0UCE9_9ZZZZ